MLADTDVFILDQPRFSGAAFVSRLDVALSPLKTGVYIGSLFLGHDGVERPCRMTMVRLPGSGNPTIQLVVSDICDRGRALDRAMTEGRKPIASVV